MKKFLLFTLLFLSTIGFAQNTAFVPVVPSGPPTITAGLPPGMTLSTTGILSGTPATAGTYQFTVQACDTENPPQCDQHTFQLLVYGRVSITTSALPPGIVTVPYTPFQIGVTGGNGTYIFTAQ